VESLDLEEPSITRTRLTGYPTNDQEVYEYDVLGNAVYLYDDVIAMPDGIYRVKNLSNSELDLLLESGGIYQIAE
jgi:hypothetical protein